MTNEKPRGFFGWRVMWAAFVLAGFGWGLGFYGPPIYLYAVAERTGWPLEHVSLAVTVHFLSGAIIVLNLPRLIRRAGVAPVVGGGALSVAIGIIGWSVAEERWQLYLAAMLTGGGWVTMSAAGINAIIARWFDRHRPVALSMAYNGAGVGGALLAPIWAFLIGWSDFTTAALIIASVTVVVVWFLSARYFAVSPEQIGQAIDGDQVGERQARPAGGGLDVLPGRRLMAHPAFLTLVAGMTIGMFAQLGLVSHLYSLLVPSLGVRGAGLTLGAATAIAIVGRMGTAWAMSGGADRRNFMAASYVVQAVGSALFVMFADSVVEITIIAALLFGLGIGNATSLPPLIAQKEFAPSDVLRVISLLIATSQATSSLAPTLFGWVREVARGAGVVAPLGVDLEFTALFGLIAAIQLLAAAAFLIGRGLAGPREGRGRAQS